MNGLLYEMMNEMTYSNLDLNWDHRGESQPSRHRLFGITGLSVVLWVQRYTCAQIAP